MKTYTVVIVGIDGTRHMVREATRHNFDEDAYFAEWEVGDGKYQQVIVPTRNVAYAQVTGRKG